MLEKFTICVIRIAFLLLYRRIFPQQWFKRTVIASGAFIVAFAIIQMLVTLLECIPIRVHWEPDTPAACIPRETLRRLSITALVFNIITDVFILTLPMPVLWQLKVPKPQRKLLIGIFSLGSGYVTSRLSFYAETLNGSKRLCGQHLQHLLSNDAFHNHRSILSDLDLLFFCASMLTLLGNSVSFVSFGMIECGLTVLFACLPTYRPLYSYCCHNNTPSVSMSTSLSKMELNNVSHLCIGQSRSQNSGEQSLSRAGESWISSVASNDDAISWPDPKNREVADEGERDGPNQVDVENRGTEGVRTHRDFYER